VANSFRKHTPKGQIFQHDIYQALHAESYTRPALCEYVRSQQRLVEMWGAGWRKNMGGRVENRMCTPIKVCEIHFTTYQRFVADHSAISPFLGGVKPRLKFCAVRPHFQQKSLLKYSNQPELAL